ncbi:cytochrome c-type biogenesis protein CcmH [Paroceanicella profunda]|uniref:Cytochrome c-type biogenesis protein n=1 Tax=Paroceanicella profunda TaxID=2579971 RepID=A0A5B8FXB1_9RHOB|nr:cytochrome c-type biogenesis protein [Paroceanicella profunda]QDL92244.1 cytochrome c-type biogenesis protein CcmH [Paroceanicella profunda]
MRALLVLLFMALAGPVLAVQPSEMLADPALEARARQISEGLRCPVCRNESIDESNADIAHDLRILVRERLAQGDTDAQVVDYIVDRYGDFVLLRPRFGGSTWALWLAGPALLLVGGGIAALFIARQRRGMRRPGAGVETLTEEERHRLDALLHER